MFGHIWDAPDKSAIPCLIKLLEDSESSVRERAVYALCQIGDKSAIPSLIQFLEDSESSVCKSDVDVLNTLEKIQENCKFYQIRPTSMSDFLSHNYIGNISSSHNK